MEKNASKQNMQYHKNIILNITAVFLLCIPGKSTTFSTSSQETWILISVEPLTRNLAWSKISVFFSFLYYQREIKIWENGSKNNIQGLPCWRSGWESACQCRGHGFKPWSGKIPHAAERLGPWATITEPARLEPVLRNKRGHDSERPAHCDEEWPPLATTG